VGRDAGTLILSEMHAKVDRHCRA